MANLFQQLVRLLFPSPRNTGPIGDPDPPQLPGPETSKPPAKTIVPLLIYPDITEGLVMDETVEVDQDKYYVSSPWVVDSDQVDEAICAAEDWLASALVTRIPWDQVRTINSVHSLSEWRTRKIALISDEVISQGLPWNADYIYLAFVRGMGGYAGGVRYLGNIAGYAMVGDVCLEAVCRYPAPTAGSVLLGEGWPSNSYGLAGQTGAFIHEALHGLNLPHPDGWPEPDQPNGDDTIMGHWWNMPNFSNTRGLTLVELEKVIQWAGG